MTYTGSWVRLMLFYIMSLVLGSFRIEKYRAKADVVKQAFRLRVISSVSLRCERSENIEDNGC